MCVFGGKKAARKAEQASREQMALQQVQMAQQQQHQAEQVRISQEANRLQEANLAFAREQSAAAAARQAEADKIAARPDAVNVSGASNNSVGDLMTNGMTGDSGVSSEDATDSRRKGRRALRIDLSAPQVAGGTGVNVPRG